METGGALIPGNPDLGIVKVKENNKKRNFFVFSCVEGAHIFAKDPERYYIILILFKKNP